MATTYITASDGTKLDAGVVALARGIKQQESGGNYTAVGDNGTSNGAYQWQPGNFQAAAKKYGLDPTDFSPVNQDKVAYQQVLDYKNQGLNPDQVAAAWNAGLSKAKSGAWQTNVGTTTIGGKPIAYDTPTYVKNVLNYYDQNKQQILNGNTSSQTPDSSSVTPQSTPDAPPSLGGFLGNIASSASNVLSGLGSAIAHPIQTVENLGNTAVGGVENALNKVTGSTYDNTQTQTAAKVGQYFAQRYGGSNPSEIASNILKTAYKDPVGVALDLSTLLDGVGAGVGAVGGIADASKASDLVNATAEGVKAMTPEAIQAASTPGTLSQVGSALRTASKYTNPIGMAASGIGAAVPAITNKIGIPILSHLTSLDPSTITSLLSDPSSFSKVAMDAASRPSIAEDFGSAIDQLANDKADTGSQYDLIRKTTAPITLPEKFVGGLLEKYGLKLDANNQVIADSNSLTRNKADIGAIQNFVDNWGNKTTLTPNEFLNMRSDIADISKFDSAKSTAASTIGKGMYADVNTNLRPQVSGLKELDAEAAPQIQLYKQAKKDFLNPDGSFKDGAINKIANAKGVGKEKLLSRMEQIRPGITKNLQIQKAVEDIEKSNGIKVGSYIHSLVEGGGLVGGVLTGNVPVVVAAILTHPAVAVQLLKGFGYTGKAVIPVLRVLNTLTGSTPAKVGTLSNVIQKNNQ